MLILINKLIVISKRLFFSIIDRIITHNKIKSLFSPNCRAMVSKLAGRRRIDDLQTVYEFWKQEKPLNNYFGTPGWTERSETILRILSSYISNEDKILETRCNTGRNLNHLRNAGYHNLRGIEISELAVIRLREAYNSLANVDIDVGPAELILSNYKDNSYDITFTMAVLEHIHPSQKDLFPQIVRITDKYILVFEPAKGHASHRAFPWDIVNKFTSLGTKLIMRKPWSSLFNTETPNFADGYDVFLFKISK